MASNRSLDEVVAHLNKLAREMRRIKREGRRLGLFMEDRDLLECSDCGLMEDVLFNGQHVTRWREDFETSEPGQPVEDTGLRFVETTDGRWLCPNCRAVFDLPEDEE